MKFTSTLLSSLALSTLTSASAFRHKKHDSGENTLYARFAYPATENTLYARSAYPATENALYARSLNELVARHEDLLARHEDLSDHLYARDADWDDFILVARSGVNKALNVADQVIKGGTAYQKSQDAAAHIQGGLNTEHHFPATNANVGSQSGKTVPTYSKKEPSPFKTTEDLNKDFSKYSKNQGQ